MEKAYVIAEIGVNYYDSAKQLNVTPIEAAKRYIASAKNAGADCVKFQSYKADKLVSKHSPAYWDTEKEPAGSQYELFRKYDGFGAEEYQELQNYSHTIGLQFTSTPFDYDSADYLYELADFYKISSSDLNNYPFIRYIAKKGKPVCLSTGASYLWEVAKAVEILKEEHCPDIVLMHCVLSYPTEPKDANLSVIQTLKTTFPNVKIGYSDHVVPDASMTSLTSAYLLGAQVLEKHFTLDKTLPGNDHYHAGDPHDFSVAVENLERIRMMLGKPDKTVLPCETVSRRQARRSLVLTRTMKKGEVIQVSDIMAKRPGTGIPSECAEFVIGRTVKRKLEADTILTWEMI